MSAQLSHRRRPIIITLAVIAVLGLSACDTDPAPAVEPPPVMTSAVTLAPAPVPADEPEEDEPGFDCATMRNKTCGPSEAALHDLT
ncbi:hypothetical protein [Amycolatopsis sp.]|uniref:hypothetical protein n=1 Tax=Amycolatopsis sp. TaxID=37632 RepID=UPI002E00C516|nr:hypothetical protein [Amycolatopsis sp.]